MYGCCVYVKLSEYLLLLIVVKLVVELIGVLCKVLYGS